MSCLTKSQPNLMLWSSQMCSDIDHVIISISNHSALIIPDVTDVLCLLYEASSRRLGVFLCLQEPEGNPCSLLQSADTCPREENTPPVNRVPYSC